MQRPSSTVACPNCGYSLTDTIAVPSSPVPTLLRVRTHTVPSSSEIKLIQSTLSHVYSNITGIDAEIDRVQAVLDSLKRKRRDLEICAEEHGSLLAPVRRLPPELLAKVFMNCLSSESYPSSSTGKKNIMRPSQICRHWRDVALSMPRLWSSIYFNGHEKSETQIALAKLWLSRTGNCSLSITVRDNSWNSVGIETIQPMIDTFLPYCNRLQHLELYDLQWSVLSSLAIAKNNLPCLETLTVHTYRHTEPESQLMDTFELAPKLHTLDLGVGTKSHDLRIPWSQLTHFAADRDIDECHSTLMSMPDITTLCIHLHFGIYLSVPITQLCQLTRLELTSMSDVGPFFDYLSCPVLRHFSYGDVGGGWNQKPFISFLSRSSCSLWSLQLQYGDLCEDELVRLLEHTPELGELRLGPTNHALSANTMSRLTYRQAPCLVPRLRHLEVYREGVYKDEDEFFIEMIESRWKMGNNAAEGIESAISQIQMVELRHADDFDRVALVRCRQLLVEGLDLRLVTVNGDPLDYDSLIEPAG